MSGMKATFFRTTVWGGPARAGAVGLLLALSAAGCTYSHGDPAAVAPCDATPQTATYAGVVSPIFDRHCRECHGSSVAATLGGGNDFGTYQGIRRYPAASLLGSIEQAPGYDAMPKGRAKLAACDILRIRAWIDAGQPNN